MEDGLNYIISEEFMRDIKLSEEQINKIKKYASISLLHVSSLDMAEEFSDFYKRSMSDKTAELDFPAIEEMGRLFATDVFVCLDEDILNALYKDIKNQFKLSKNLKKFINLSKLSSEAACEKDNKG